MEKSFSKSKHSVRGPMYVTTPLWLLPGIWASASSFAQEALHLVLNQHAYWKVWHYWPHMLSNCKQYKAAGLYLFVEWPDLIPLHVDHRPGATLCENRKNKETKTIHTDTQWKTHACKSAKTHTWAAMNCLSPSTVIPLRRTPLTVGNRGSSLGERQTQSTSLHINLKRINNNDNNFYIYYIWLHNSACTHFNYEPLSREGSDSPAIHIALIHKPGEFPLGQQRVVEIEPSVFPDVGLP